MKLVRPVMAASAGVLLLSLTACGGGNDSQAASAQQGSQSGQQGAYADQGGAAGAGRFPGATGLVAAVSGKTLQVQGLSGQTVVTYTASTTFSAQVVAKLADVKVGSCVVVTPVQDGATSGSGDTQQTAVTAASVRITAAENGTCTGGFGGGRPSGAPSGMPTDRPSDPPSGAPGGTNGGRRMFGAVGKVASVSGTGFSLTSQAPAASGGSSTATTVAVTVSGDTTYTTTRQATATALAVGKCVSANGQTDATGALTAQRITVSDAVDGQCTGGFGGFGGGPGGAGGAGGTATAGASS